MATKADFRRAIVRTAALAHWRHHFTACAHPANDDAAVQGEFQKFHTTGIYYV
ncbi:hypothetical protein [Novosphingobium indicum]|uniref:hypothetical protein n=1 Tax=Novosphingobium indicum TaxID=462949 RepID=UPI00166C56B4|nr:hypothetical protein [Novosphingobium indicum]